MSFFHKNTGAVEANSFLTLIAEYAAETSEDKTGYVCLDFEIWDNKIRNVYVYSEGYSSFRICDLRKLTKTDWDNTTLLGWQKHEKNRVRYVVNLASDHCVTLQ